jgi:hypothetical protein
MIGTMCVKLKPASTTSMHSGFGNPGAENSWPCGIRAAAARHRVWVSTASRTSMVGGHTRGAKVRLKFVFLKDELIVDFLDVGQVEVRLCYEK